VLPRSRLQSGQETPLQYATEDTPAVFSRNDSLSSLEFDEGGGTGLPGTKGNTINQLFLQSEDVLVLVEKIARVYGSVADPDLDPSIIKQK
jgi:hypothetical protein